MNAFCTHCGASLSAGTAFCNACGLGVSPPAVPIQDKIPNKRRSRWWVLAITVFFVLGILLGRLFGPTCPECPSVASSGGSGAAASGRGHPAQADEGKAPAGGKPISGPADADAGGGVSKLDPPDGTGKIIPHDLQGKDFDGGRGELKGDTDNAPPDHALHMTPDVVASSVSYVNTLKPGDNTGAYGTGAVIVTSSSFNDVVAWYQSNVPPGWQSTTISNFSQLARQAKNLSGDKITQLLLGQAGETAPTGKPAAAPVPNISMSLFKPPGVAAASQNSSIMIIQEEGKPVTVYLQAKVD
ncbi:MAG: zinc ribbon domain-containing protein [Gammaproteobacteria bacterium]